MRVCNAAIRVNLFRCFASLSSKPTVSVIGVPFSGGQPIGGVDLAPDVIRKCDLKARIEDLHWNVKDMGNLVLPARESFPEQTFGRVKNCLWTGAVNKLVAEVTEKEARQGNFPLVLGGDHSIAVGSISGLCRVYNNLGVLWIDAHADINTSGTTPSGNLHGMPLSLLLGLTPPVPGFEWLDMSRPPLVRDQLVYIGLRDLQNEEKEYLRAQNIKAFDMHDVDKYGIGGVMDHVHKILGHRPVHLSFDIDGLDAREAPSTGTAVRGGLTFREGAYICEEAHKYGKLVGMDMVEINPTIGSFADVDLTVASGISMIKAALGETLV